MERFTYLRSFHESIKDCEPAIRLEIFDAISTYCFEDREPTLNIPMARAIWNLIRPFLKNSKKQSMNGAKGGAVVGNRNACKTKVSVVKNKPKTSQKQAKNKPKEDLFPEMDNSSANTAIAAPKPLDENFIKWNNWIKENAPFCANPSNIKQLTEDEFLRLKSRYTSVQIRDTILNLENRRDKRKTYTNLYRTLINWLKRDYGE